MQFGDLTIEARRGPLLEEEEKNTLMRIITSTPYYVEIQYGCKDDKEPWVVASHTKKFENVCVPTEAVHADIAMGVKLLAHRRCGFLKWFVRFVGADGKVMHEDAPDKPVSLCCQPPMSVMNKRKNEIERVPFCVYWFVAEFEKLYPDDECVKQLVVDSRKHNLLNNYKVSDNIWQQVVNIVRLHEREATFKYRENMYSLFIKDEFASEIPDPLPADWGIGVPNKDTFAGHWTQSVRQSDPFGGPVIRVPKRVRMEDSVEVVRSTRRCIVDGTFVCFDASPDVKGFDLVDRHDSFLVQAGHEISDISNMRVDLVLVLPDGEDERTIDAKKLLACHKYRYTFDLDK